PPHRGRLRSSLGSALARDRRRPPSGGRPPPLPPRVRAVWIHGRIFAGHPPAVKSVAHRARFQTMVDVRPLVVRGIVLVHSSPARLAVTFRSVPTWFANVLPVMR